MNLVYIDTILAFAAIMAGVSLIITALNQFISAVLGLRGLNLKWGLEELFRNVAPDLGARAGELAGQVLHHPLVSDSMFAQREKGPSWWRYATHIRKEELIKLLDDWAAAVDLPEKTPQERARKIRVLETLQVPAAFRDLKTEAFERIMELESDLEGWFDSAMDRVAQRFASNMRVVTVGCAFLVTAVLLFDSGSVWKRLSEDPDLRAQALAGIEVLRTQADEMGAGATLESPAVYRQAARDLIARHTNVLAGVELPSGATNLASGRQWLREQLEARQVPAPETYLAEYVNLIPQARVVQASENLRDLLRQQSQLGLIPPEYPGGVLDWFCYVWGHKWGLLTSVILLSLGAPFWFNLLKSMSSLRPLLAKKEDAEKR